MHKVGMGNVLLVPWFKYYILMTLGGFENWDLQRAWLEEVTHWKSRSLQVYDLIHFQGWARDEEPLCLISMPGTQPLQHPSSAATSKPLIPEPVSFPAALMLLPLGFPSH